jgi:hypothetical protein
MAGLWKWVARFLVRIEEVSVVALIGLLVVIGIFETAGAEGQAPNEQQSGVTVMKSNWKKGVRGGDMGRSIYDPAQSRSRNPANDDPFQRMREAGRRMRAREDGYYYSVTFRNDGTKPVKALVWDYTVASPGVSDSLTHHQFYNRVDIRPGKHKEVYRFTVTPPTRTVSAAKGDSRLVEEVIVKAVQYKDGSVWKLQQKAPDSLPQQRPAENPRP